MTDPAADDQHTVDPRQALTAGWSPLPLASRTKSPPPDGWTGVDAPMASGADVEAWVDAGAYGNVALRFPLGVVGVDVDAYDGKPGAATWAELDGDSWPATWILSSRFGPSWDGSGIRLYRLPEGLEERELWGAHRGVELIRHGHRYAVGPGSIHPEGKVYAVQAPDRTMSHEAPDVSALPRLSAAQGALLTRAGAPWASDTWAAWEAPEGTPCGAVATILAAGLAALTQEQGRHEAIRAVVMKLVRAGEQGHTGTELALRGLETSYVRALQEAPGKRPAHETTRAALLATWGRMVTGAQELAARTPSADWDRIHRCPQAVETAVEEPAQPDVSQEEALTPEEVMIRAELRRLRINLAARDRLWPKERPPEAVTLAELLEEELPPIRPLVGGWMDIGSKTLLTGANKAGKTTLLVNLVAALADGGPGTFWLGNYEVTKPEGPIHVLDTEMDRRRLQEWTAGLGIRATSDIVIHSLRGRVSSLDVLTPEGRDYWGQRLAGAGFVLLDPVGPVLAAAGLEENSNADVGRFLAGWDEVIQLAGGPTNLVAHHLGKQAETARGASAWEGWPDAVWNLTRTSVDEEEVRALGAFGRDIAQAAQVLSYDPTTKRLGLAGYTKGDASAAVLIPELLEWLGEHGPSSTKAVEEGLGGRRENVRRALKVALQRELVVMSKGIRGAKLYRLPD